MIENTETLEVEYETKIRVHRLFDEDLKGYLDCFEAADCYCLVSGIKIKKKYLKEIIYETLPPKAKPCSAENIQWMLNRECH